MIFGSKRSVLPDKSKKQRAFFSLNAKIFLVLILSVAGMCSLFFMTFMDGYIRQLDRESVLLRRKTDAINELFEENMRLRRAITALNDGTEKRDRNPMSIRSGGQNELFALKPLDDRILAARRELVSDLNSGRVREEKMRELGYGVSVALLLVFFVLELLWLIVRRWVLNPVAKMVEATHHISSGDFSFRVPVASRFSKQDELDLLARDFNKMAQDIENNIRDIRESEIFLQNLIDTIPDGIRVLDDEYNIVLTNRAYNEMCGGLFPRFPKKCFEVCGNALPCAPDQRECPLQLLKQNPDRPVTLIQRYADADGRDLFFEVSAAAAFHKKEEITELWVIEMIRPLDKTVMLSHQQKLSSVGMLASSVAHEMRNPLGSVRLILENILDKMDSNPMKADDLKKYLSLVHEQICHCITVTSRMLKLSRKADGEFSPVDLVEVVTETAGLLEYEAKKSGIDVAIDVETDSAVVLASDAEMRMMTVNLMQNAFHAMAGGGKMRISITGDGKNVGVDFIDTGCGIPSGNLPRIFEPFFSERRNDGNGTGLGLAIVKSIVQSCGGSISVESTVGEGTVFHLVFKAHEK